MRDAFGEYLNRVGAVPLLTKEDEQRLGKLVLEGRQAAEKLKLDPDNEDLQRAVAAGERAREEFVKANLRLVISVIRKHFGTSKLHFEDLIQYGNMGLIRAVDKFDYRRGFRFSTYATAWIRNFAGRAGYQFGSNSFQHTDRSINQVRAIQKERNALENERGRFVTDAEVAQELGWDVETVRQALARDETMVSLDACLNPEDYDSQDLGDVTADRDAVDFDEVVAQHIAVQYGQQALASLEGDDRRLVEMRFGFGEYPPQMTYKQIAAALGVSTNTLRNHERYILHRLRSLMPEVEALMAS